MRNVNDAECVDFAEYARDRELAVRFIEYMPFDGNRWRSEKMVPYGELRTRIEKAFGRELVADVDEAHDTTKVRETR